ncbi:MAG: response regulator [Thermodesulfobacteriota bacterium]|nr:response regulator [Thermodesulfobacteriota bacterium]
MREKLTKILVVDDELPICDILDEFLSLQGYQITTATNGQDALSLFEGSRPHMVLLDLSMPGMSGMEVLRRIRAVDKETHVIIASAFGDSDTVREALKMGANYYMEKPIDLDHLLNMLAALRQSTEIRGGDEIS